MQRVLSDGQWPRAVVMLGDFLFLLHYELPSLSSPHLSLSLCCRAAVNTSQILLMSSFSSQEHLFLTPRLCLFSALSLAHSQSTTSHSLIKSKRAVALFLAAVNSHTHRSRPPPRIRSLQRQHSSSLITQKIQLNVFRGRGCL